MDHFSIFSSTVTTSPFSASVTTGLFTPPFARTLPSFFTSACSTGSQLLSMYTRLIWLVSKDSARISV